MILMLKNGNSYSNYTTEVNSFLSGKCLQTGKWPVKAKDILRLLKGEFINAIRDRKNSNGQVLLQHRTIQVPVSSDNLVRTVTVTQSFDREALLALMQRAAHTGDP
jgi:hypothetical protein